MNDLPNQTGARDNSDPTPARAPILAFAPSEYTGLLMGVMQGAPDLINGQRVCEIGTGSGAIALFAASLGAKEVVATDTEEAALDTARAQAQKSPEGARISFRSGSLWDAVAGERFDLILANLPHFPASALELPGRLPSWGAGGEGGRDLLDPFLEGLGAHLAAGGEAFLTHNRFVCLGRTGEILARQGLGARPVAETLVYLPPAKVAALSKQGRASADNANLSHRLGNCRALALQDFNLPKLRYNLFGFLSFSSHR